MGRRVLLLGMLGMAKFAMADMQRIHQSDKTNAMIEKQSLPLGYSLGHAMHFVSSQALNHKYEECDFNALKAGCSLAFLELQEEKIDFNALKDICGRKVRFIAKLRMYEDGEALDRLYLFENNRDRDRLTNFVKRDTGVIRIEWYLFYKSWLGSFFRR